KRIMARAGGAVVVLFVLAFLFASSAASTPKCCKEAHQWGPQNQKPGCAIPEQNESCSKWCQPTCRGGECKIRGGRHVCHCYC
ncbi:hypothetical protein EJB05_42454, partial [Eragrostis curvula]